MHTKADQDGWMTAPGLPQKIPSHRGLLANSSQFVDTVASSSVILLSSQIDFQFLVRPLCSSSIMVLRISHKPGGFFLFLAFVCLFVCNLFYRGPFWKCRWAKHPERQTGNLSLWGPSAPSVPSPYLIIHFFYGVAVSCDTASWGCWVILLMWQD